MLYEDMLYKRYDKHVIITYDEGPYENWYISGEQSSEDQKMQIGNCNVWNTV
jgi:hypothetical protein